MTLTAAETKSRLLATQDADEAAALFTHIVESLSYDALQQDQEEWSAFAHMGLNHLSLDGSASPCRDPDSIKAWSKDKVVIWNKHGRGYIAVPRSRIIETRSGSWRLVKVA